MFARDAAVSEAVDSEELRCSEGSCMADCTRRELLFTVCDRGSLLCSGHKASWTLAKTLIEIELWVDLRADTSPSSIQHMGNPAGHSSLVDSNQSARRTRRANQRVALVVSNTKGLRDK